MVPAIRRDGTDAPIPRTKSGKIIMNIQATGSSIGNLYATKYGNAVTDRAVT